MNKLEQLNHDMTILEAVRRNDTGTPMAALDIAAAALKVAQTAKDLRAERLDTTPDRPPLSYFDWAL